MANAGLQIYLFCTFIKKNSISQLKYAGNMGQFVRKWHMNSILYFDAMVSHDNLNICEPSYLEIPIIKIRIFWFLLAIFLS